MTGHIGGLLFWLAVGAALVALFVEAYKAAKAQPDEGMERPEYADARPPTIPVLRDIEHPERWPKTWAYRERAAAEETREIGRIEP